MEINIQDAKDIKQLLEDEILAGNVYVSYDPDLEAMQKSDLKFFPSSYDAWEFCHENSTDVDLLEYKSIVSFSSLLDEIILQTQIGN